MIKADLSPIEEVYLEFIEHVDNGMKNEHGRQLKYLVTGGWAVDGICGKVTRYHENVDLMVPKDNMDKFVSALYAYNEDAEVSHSGKNIHAEAGSIRADVIIMYPIGEEYAFDTPYHNDGAPVWKHLVRGQRVKLNGVGFVSLNAGALYYAKLCAIRRTSKEKNRDERDLRRLAPFVPPKDREQMRAYARI